MEPFLVITVLSAENSPDSLIYGFTPANLINFPAFEYLLMSPSSAKIEVPVIIDIPGIDVIEEVLLFFYPILQFGNWLNQYWK